MTVFEFAARFPSLLEMPETRRVRAIFDGAETALVLESVPTKWGRFLTFRPENWSRERALTVGERFECDEKDVLRPWGFEYQESEGQLPEPINWANAVREISAGRFGFLDVDDYPGTFFFRFFGVAGLVYTEAHEDPNWSLTPGMIMPAPEPDELIYDPKLRFRIWETPPQTLEKLKAGGVRKTPRRLSKKEREEKEKTDFQFQWAAWDETQRRTFLPPLELEIEAEITQAMRWILRADTSFEGRNLFDSPFFSAQNRAWRKEQKCFWRCPRFLVSDGKKWGQLQPENLDFKASATFIQKLWPQIIGAFELEIEELKPLQSEVHPIVWKWCHWRGAYTVTFEPSTSRHEQIEALSNLSEWLQMRTGRALEL